MDRSGESVFQGITQLTLDDKARLAIPARYREALKLEVGGQLVVTVDPSGCLLLYPRSGWEPIRQQLMSLSSFNPQVRALQRLLVGHAEDVEMDGSGRVLLSQPLRQFAQLEKQQISILVGQGNKFELWELTRWQKQTESALQQLASGETGIPAELQGFSL